MVIIRLVGSWSKTLCLKSPFLLLPVAVISCKKENVVAQITHRSFLYELKVKHVASFMFPSLWSVGGPVWLSSDDLLIAIQYGSLEKEPLSQLVTGKEVVTWSHCKSWQVIQLRIHLSVFQLQNVLWRNVIIQEFSTLFQSSRIKCYLYF